MMLLVTSFSSTALAQHYVQVKNDVTSENGKKLYAGSILSSEVSDTTSVLYIHVIKMKQGMASGVTEGNKYLITKYSPTLGGIHFNDDKNKDRSDCFSEGKVLVKIENDYIPYNDICFRNASQVNFDKRIDIENEIKVQCSYDSSTQQLDLKNCSYEYIYKGNRLRDNILYGVLPNAEIEFLTGGKGIPNIIISAEHFVKQPTQVYVQGKDGYFWSWVSKNWVVIACIALGVCLLIVVIVLSLKKRKHTNDDEYVSKDEKGDFDNYEDRNKKKKVEKNRQNNPDINRSNQNSKSDPNGGATTSNVDTLVSKNLIDILAKVESTQNMLSKQASILDNIKVLVSNTEDKKQLAIKIQELNVEKNKSAKALLEKDNAIKEISNLKTEIEKLRTGVRIEGAIQVGECSTFVSFAKKVVNECVDSEKLAIKYWSTLTNKEQQILNGFVSKYQLTKCNIDLIKWNGILATLDLKGYIKNDEYITYLTPLSDKEKLQFLNKRFFEEVLRPYVGATILFLEQIRTAPKLGVSTPCNENIEGYINSICTKCIEQGVLIDYRKLYETVSEYDSLEIEDNIPNAIRDIIANIDAEDTLLYVDKYAVNLKSGEMPEKTRCFIKI